MLWVGQGSLGRSEDIGLQGEQGGEGPELGGKGERCLLLDQRFLSPMPETMGPARRLLVQGVGLGLPVPNGQGLVVPRVGVGDILVSPCSPPSQASAWEGTALWVPKSSSPSQPTSPREGGISTVRTCGSGGEKDGSAGDSPPDGEDTGSEECLQDAGCSPPIHWPWPLWPLCLLPGAAGKEGRTALGPHSP